MRIPTLLFALILSVVTVNASLAHDGAASSHHYITLAQRQANALQPAKSTRNACRKRVPSSSAANIAAVVSSTPVAKKTAPLTTYVAPNPISKAAPAGNNGGSSRKIINLESACGNSNATALTTKDGGPNGSIEWLNCGIDRDGWTPPHLDLDNLVYKSLDEALNMPNSPFEACRQYIRLFEIHGAATKIPAIMIAAFALQESSCRADVVGGGGEQGLMQITQDKCGSAPDGNCKDPDYNIGTGARYFADQVKKHGGNILVAVGAYNGWFLGMTYADATRARYTECCTCQNNIDYLHAFLNGWCQGIKPLNKYNNLAVCSQ